MGFWRLGGIRRAWTLAGAVVLGLGILAAPARAHGPSADDYVPYAPSGFFVFDWSGPYVGGNLGLAFTLAEATETIFETNVLFIDTPDFDQSETSVTGGAQAGWQKQWGKLVAGIELGFSLLNFDTTARSSAVLLEDRLTRSAELSNIFTVTGRLGYADGRWLAYAKGGLANGDVDVTYNDALTGNSTSSSGRETGWTAGVGIDYALTPNVFLGVEYNYLHFRADVKPPPLPNFNPNVPADFIPTDFSGVDVDTQNVVVRLNYRFSGWCCIGHGWR